MNRVELIGNLARDPELRYSTGENQTAVCRFTLAVNEGFGEKKRTSFIQIITFGKTAENCNKFLAKGRQAAVCGKIQTGSYTNKDGVKVYTTDIVADSVEFLGSGNREGGRNGEGAPAPANPAGGPAPQAPAQQAMDGFTEMADDDIPF